MRICAALLALVLGGLSIAHGGLSIAGAGSEGVQRLLVSANHRFLQHADGTPFFWLGDTAWLLFSRLDRTETIGYLEDRRDKGFTVIQVMLLHEADDRAHNGAPALENGDPARPRVTPGDNPSNAGEYDYWDHVDWVAREATARGLYLALVPAWGSLAKSGALNSRTASEYGAFLARRYRNHPNIVWMVGGDAKGNEQLDTWNALGRALRAGDPNHLITYHPFGRTQSSTWFHDQPWLDFNMFQSGHRRYDQDTDSPQRFGEDNWRYVLDDYAKVPPKPVIDGEPSYEGIPQGLHDPAQPYWTDNDARRYAYWSVFAGSFGHTYGHNAVMQFHREGSESSYSPRCSWSECLGAPGARQMGKLALLMRSRPFFERVYDPGAVVDSGAGHDRVIATRGRDYLMVYTYFGRSFELRLGRTAGDVLRGWWFNPRDGSSVPLGRIANRGTRRFSPPGTPAEGHDFVLVLDDEAKGYRAPGVLDASEGSRPRRR